MKDFYMLLNVFRKVTCFAKRNFYKGFEAVAIVVSVIDACLEKYYFRSRVLDASVDCRLSPENVRQPRSLWSSRIRTKNRWPRLTALSLF